MYDCTLQQHDRSISKHQLLRDVCAHSRFGRHNGDIKMIACTHVWLTTPWKIDIPSSAMDQICLGSPGRYMFMRLAYRLHKASAVEYSSTLNITWCVSVKCEAPDIHICNPSNPSRSSRQGSCSILRRASERRSPRADLSCSRGLT